MSLSIDIRHHFLDFELNVSAEVPDGLTVLFGPSGSGKTTLINAVAGLLRPDEGRIAVADSVLLDTAARHCLPTHRRRLGYVFQEDRLFPHMTVRQNLRYGRLFAPRDSHGESFEKIVDLLGIGHLLGRRPGALSGGEKQRVAIGRALLAHPQLILADEPLAALDEARKAEILPYFERLRDEIAIPILYVSHSTVEVARLATTVIALRAGKVTAVGPPAKVLGDTAAVAPGEIASLLNARVVEHHADGLTELATDAGTLWLTGIAASTGSVLRIRVVANDVILSPMQPSGLSALNVLVGTISEIRSVSDAAAVVTLALPTAQIVARITHRSVAALELAVGQRCHAIVKSVAVDPGSVSAGNLHFSSHGGCA